MIFLNSFFAFILLLWLCILSVTESLNILAVMPHQGRSHQMVFESLFVKLASNGHNVTLVTWYPLKIPLPNWRDVNIAPRPMNIALVSSNIITETRLDRYSFIPLLAMGGNDSCNSCLPHPNYQKFLKEDNRFDVILIEVLNVNCFFGVAKRYNAPVIGLSPSILMPWMYQWFGSSSNPSFVPNYFIGYTDHMDFLSRVENTVINVFSYVIYKYLMHYPSNRWSIQYTGIDLQENGDVMTNISLLLINSHYTLNSKMPTSPNTIEVGGIHLDSKPVKQLPQDMEQFIKEAKHGIIYMSLGSAIRGDFLTEIKVHAFLKAFSKLSQRVIWKWEGAMKNKPKNVMTTKWAPQRDILCDPNIRIFISHGGISGTIETVDCGTPTLVIPIFTDQFTNAASIEQKGVGLVLQLKDITEEAVYDKLQKLLSPKFKENMKELSNRFKDRPLSPMNTALYWIDYVVRHKGASFMKLASIDMPLYQYYLLDVIAFIFLIAVIYIYILHLFLKFVFRKICKKQKIKKS